ncbi:MAG: YchJ family metal-binding protein [Sulfurimonadaceae bacterium]|jgi:SEC-C motif-containing protein|nr:YchJ family metal-binding protein [Sulfurimonadaceae bacterium]
MECYCKSKKEFSECCEPYLSGDKKAPSALELMRSRYSAYVLGNGYYIVNTASKESRYKDDITLIEEYARSVRWLGLEIVKAEKNVVEFKAYYEDNSGLHVQHERSNFIFEDGFWLYKDGKLFNSKIERNIQCPCQSGKKYKKCCKN